MILRDFHVHTRFSDGKNTPEEMVLAALEKGMTAIGFSDHSYTFFDENYCVPRDRIVEYRDTVRRLKEKYKDRIDVFCGIEQDLFSRESTAEYDYVIGSVHYLQVGERYIPVDESSETLRWAVETYFSGDPYALAEEYYAQAAEVAEKTGADLIGHFDLLMKFNQKTRLLDENHPRYRAAWQAAADRLLNSKAAFEWNTGAMSRGYRSVPYPSPEIQAYLRSHGGILIPSSDSHRADTLCYGFELFALQ